MSDLVTIASSAVSLYQRALGTVSNNIANVDTDGYTRQELDQKENNTRQFSGQNNQIVYGIFYPDL